MGDTPNIGRPSRDTPASSSKRERAAMTHQGAQHPLAAKLANPERRAHAVNTMYDRQFSGHGNSRHGAQTTFAQHGQRVLTGANPDGGNGRAVRKSSRWANQQTQLAARHSAQNAFRNGVRPNAAPEAQNGNGLAFSPNLGRGQTGQQATRLGSVRNPTGVARSPAHGAKVVLRPDGGFLTDFPE
jgi:hypothetical protein